MPRPRARSPVSSRWNRVSRRCWRRRALHADEIEAEARAQAGLRAGALEGELAAADVELTAALAAEAEARIARERALLAEARARYEAVDAAGLAAHADWVVEQVLRMASEGSP